MIVDLPPQEPALEYWPAPRCEAPLTVFRSTPLWKRAFDVTAACGVLVLAAPLLVAIALHIKLASRGPVFFRQRRVGARGESFWILKFRTMRHDVDQRRHAAHVRAVNETGGTPTKLDVSGDLIPGGAWLRRCSLDELPQLWNVLRGEMSLVGPRPDVLPAEEYESWAQRRFSVAPGVTGLWQVQGKNALTWQEMLACDIEYAERRSPLLDAKILLHTIPLVLGGNSA